MGCVRGIDFKHDKIHSRFYISPPRPKVGIEESTAHICGFRPWLDFALQAGARFRLFNCITAIGNSQTTTLFSVKFCQLRHAGLVVFFENRTIWRLSCLGSAFFPLH